MPHYATSSIRKRRKHRSPPPKVVHIPKLPKLLGKEGFDTNIYLVPPPILMGMCEAFIKVPNHLTAFNCAVGSTIHKMLGVIPDGYWPNDILRKNHRRWFLKYAPALIDYAKHVEAFEDAAEEYNEHIDYYHDSISNVEGCVKSLKKSQHTLKQARKRKLSPNYDKWSRKDNLDSCRAAVAEDRGDLDLSRSYLAEWKDKSTIAHTNAANAVKAMQKIVKAAKDEDKRNLAASKRSVKRMVKRVKKIMAGNL